MNPTVKSSWNGLETTLSWIRTDDISSFSPITQCHVACFDSSEKILIVRKLGKEWHLPGGRPEAGETLAETVIREVFEEADVIVADVRILGVQRVDFPNNPNQKEGELYYQARFVCHAQETRPQTPDPDTGIVWERRFVPIGEVTAYIKWGLIGEVLFREASEIIEA